MKTKERITRNPINNKHIGYVYSPNSIHHGSKVAGMSKELLLNIEIARLTDFIEFLFDHSEHCNHISESDAWKEFEIYEIGNSNFREKISQQRKSMKAPITNPTKP